MLTVIDGCRDSLKQVFDKSLARGIPELEAVSTASSTAAQARQAGGIDILDKLQQKHMKIKYLGWTTNGNKFRIYTKNPPKFAPNGLPDFTGVKMRDNPIYGAFLKACRKHGIHVRFPFVEEFNRFGRFRLNVTTCGR